MKITPNVRIDEKKEIWVKVKTLEEGMEVLRDRGVFIRLNKLNFSIYVNGVLADQSKNQRYLYRWNIDNGVDGSDWKLLSPMEAAEQGVSLGDGRIELSPAVIFIIGRDMYSLFYRENPQYKPELDVEE